MSNEAITAEKYLEILAEAAALKIAQGTTPHTITIMVPVWKQIIIDEIKPILRLIT